MARKLKLGFAMGGGVSLGTFSGAALSEAIKQVVLQGGYYEKAKDGSEEFKLYEEIEIDVFSGASAGAMSLAIMLRGLAHQTQAERDHAELRLLAEGIDLHNMGQKRKENLIVAQVVQTLQEEIWTKEINIDKLLGTTPAEKSALTFEGGLLRRGALEDIVKKYFDLSEAFKSNFGNKRLLANEVIFANTLANLTGLKYDCREGNVQDNPNFSGSDDAFTSYVHKELRVFHLFFNKITQQTINKNPENFPDKWVRYHIGAKKPGYFGDLRNKTSWSRMVATSMACGAFPFAFEPVVLERFKFEYGRYLWPDALTPEVCKLATEATGTIGEADLSYPFTYVDGGTFNNEPVREAFRLASFMDAEEASAFDRVIIFVDPAVSDKEVNFRVPVHQQFAMREPRKWLGVLDGYDLERRTTIDRLSPHIGSLITMIVNEGRVNESDKIQYIADLFKKKEEYYELIYKLTRAVVPDQALVSSICSKLNEILNAEKLNSLVPRGALTLRGELIRIAKDQGKKLGSISNSDIDLFLKSGLQALPAALHIHFLNALYLILLDLLMDLSGKSQDSKIIAIAPVVRRDGVEYKVPLPGRYLMAFAGFTSPYANAYTLDIAKFCTRLLMKELRLLPNSAEVGEEREWKDKDDQILSQEFRSKLVNMDARIDNLLLNASFIDFFPGIDRLVLSQLSIAIKNQLNEFELKDDPKWSFLFMVEVPDKTYEIDGLGSFNDTAPVFIDNKLYLIAELNYYHKRIKDQWSGKHVQGNELVIDRDGTSVLPDRAFCTINLPSSTEVKLANLMPNPVFMFRRLSSADKGKNLSAAEWQIKPGVQPIEKTLL